MSAVFPLGALLLAVSIASTIYWTAALTCVAAFGRRRRAVSAFAPPVSVLKPLCGRDPGLLENLRSFCEQDYPDYQIVFGVPHPDDPAVDVVEALAERYPGRDIALVVGHRAAGSNPKMSNVVNLYGAAKHDVLVLSDGDIRVGPGYLQAVVGPLEDPATGLTTCLYRGVAADGPWSRLGALFVNQWFFPSALVGASLAPMDHAFGATQAARREVLEDVGGFPAVADYLADDFMLGQLVTRRGRRVTLASYVVDTVVTDRKLPAFFFHELRWARTLRAVRPLGYFFSVITYGFPFAVLALVMAPAAWGVVACAAHVLVRVAASRTIDRTLSIRGGSGWWLPVRDTLSLLLWALAFAGRTVRWRGRRFTVERDGRLTAAPDARAR
ncbi:MAG: bacteriohopanetetrol glucosamine biosynthesis glycosyltransferase HpnI [Candidatus Rokuibacteriota bacterium]